MWIRSQTWVRFVWDHFLVFLYIPSFVSSMCLLWNAMGSLSVDLQMIMASGIEKKAGLECRVEYYALPVNNVRMWDCGETKQLFWRKWGFMSPVCSISDEWLRSSTTERCLTKYIGATYTRITGGFGNNILCILSKKKKDINVTSIIIKQCICESDLDMISRGLEIKLQVNL